MVGRNPEGPIWHPQPRKKRNLWGKSKPGLCLLLFLKEVQSRLRKGRAGGLITVKTSMEFCRRMSQALIPLADKESPAGKGLSLFSSQLYSVQVTELV